MDSNDEQPSPREALIAHLHLLFGGYETDDIVHALDRIIPHYCDDLYVITGTHLNLIRQNAGNLMNKIQRVQSLLTAPHNSGYNTPLWRILSEVTDLIGSTHEAASIFNDTRTDSIIRFRR